MANLGGSVVDFGGPYVTRAGGAVAASATRSIDRSAALLEGTFADTGARPAGPRRRGQPPQVAHRLSAQIVDRGTKRGVAHLRIEAWDANTAADPLHASDASAAQPLVSDLVALACTDATGHFTMTITTAQMRSLFSERRPVLRLRLFVISGAAPGALPEPAWKWHLGPSTERARIEVDANARASELAPAPSALRGRVRSRTGVPIAGATVEAVDVGLPQEVSLGTDTTDSDGYYAIAYATDPGSTGCTVPELVVRAYAPGRRGAPRLIARSTIHCQAPPTLRVDLTVGGSYLGPSRYEQIVARLGAASARLGDRSTVELERLACRTDASRDDLERLASAQRVGAMTSLDDEVLFGLMSVGLPMTYEELLETHPRDVRGALVRARQGNYISPRHGARMEAILERFRSAVISPAVDNLPPARAALAYALPSAAHVRAFIEAYLRHEERDDQAFWVKLGRHPMFARGDLIARAKFVLMAAALSNPQRLRATTPDESFFGARGSHAGPPIDLFEAHHAPFVSRLVERRNQGAIQHIADLAAFTRAQWETLMDGVGAPDEVPGLNAVERARRYTAHLRQTVQRLYPMRAAVASISAQTSTGSGALTAFFTSPANRSLVLGETRIARHLARTTGSLADVPEAQRSALVDDLKTIERLHKITTDHDEIEKLRTGGIHSSAHAHALGAKRLAKMTGLSLAAATRIVNKACAVAGGATALQARYASTFDTARVSVGGTTLSKQISVGVLPDKASLKPDLAPPLPDWNHLFGNPDVCDCEHCHSVLSPAAYLVDLLCFLESIDAGSNHTARDVLLSNGSGPFPPRRPDIAKIDLSCKDTDTPLPYVDVVSEILTHVAVAIGNNQTTFSYGDHISTKGSPRDLLAAPEILEPATQALANELLAGALYPTRLPFNFWLAEARAFLSQLGVTLHELMQALSPEGPPDPSEPLHNDKRYLPPPYVYDQLAWSERLGFFKSSMDWFNEGLTTPNPARWGFAPNDATWATKLLSAKTFLERSGLSYEELLSLLDTEFIRNAVAPNAPNPHLGPEAAVDACDVDKMSIVGFATNPGMVWGALSKVLFLKERLGYTIDEVDQSFLAVVSDSVDDALAQNAIIEHFHGDRGVELPVALSWFGTMDTRRRGRPKQPSFFQRVFQSPTLGAPANPAFDLQNVPDYITPTELADTSPLLADHAPAICGALGLSARDFSLLTDSSASTALVGLAAELPSDVTHLTLANLSQIHRLATFARALGLSIGDFLILKRLFGDSSDPLYPGRRLFTPENAYLFAEVVDRVKSGPFKPADLLFIFFGLATPACGFAPTSARLEALVKKLSKELVAIRQTAEGASDPDGTRVLPLLELLFASPARASKANRILLGNDVPPGGEGDEDNLSDAQWFDNHLAELFSHSNAASHFIGSSAPERGALRSGYAFGHLRAFVECEKRIIQTLASDLKIAPDTAAVLLTIVKSAGGASIVKSWRLAQYDPDDPNQSAPTVILPDFAGYQRLHRAAAPARVIGMSAAELARVSVHGEGLAPTLRLFDVNELVNPSPGGTVAPEEWFRRFLLLADLWKLRGELVLGPAALLALLPLDPGEANYDFIVRTTAATGWPAEDVVALTARMLPSAFQTPSAGPPPALPDIALALVRLRYAFNALRPLRVSAKTVIDKWFKLGTAPATTLSQENPSASIVETVRARYPEDQWPDVARPLRDRVRQGQRTALVDYLIGSGYAAGTDDLYAWLLVDVEMEPVMLTSRIKQAIGSVQTFVQRALMNMEPHVKLDADQAKRWAWMKNYRVWEADRKVFLYPENWIEPALRDDKTTFFKQLESDLRRQDLTDENVEQAYVRYLEKLAEVSSLEIVAMHHEEPASGSGCGASDVLHLIGRTVSQPKRYFYCAGRRAAGVTRPRRWSPWEPIDLEIASDHLLIHVYHRRLYLFWASMEEKPDGNQNIPKKGNNNDPLSDGDEDAHTHLEVRLSWSERGQDRWSAPRTSTESLSTEYYYRNTVTVSPLYTNRRDFNLSPSDITLGIAVTEGRLIITCFLRLLRLTRIAMYSGSEYSWFSKAFGYFYIDPCSLAMTTAESVRYSILAWSELEHDYTLQIAELEQRRQGLEDLKTATDSLVSSSDKEELLADLQRNIEALTQQIDALPNASSPVLFHVGPSPDVTVTALRFSDWTWSWAGQQIRPTQGGPNPPALVVQDGTIDVALLQAGVTSSAVVLREPVLTLPKDDKQSEIGYPFAEKRPLVLRSVNGPLRGTSFLFERREEAAGKGKAPPYRAVNLFHASTCAFLTRIRRDGIDALLGDRALQMSSYDPIGNAQTKGTNLAKPDTAVVDFSDGGLYSIFNWELFFHAPLHIATRLSANRRYAEAQKWFHRIFDPTQGKGKAGTPWAKPPYSFWKVRPFFENKDLGTIQEELVKLDGSSTSESKALNGLDEGLGTSTAVQKLLDQIEAWRANPFKPHAIARLRPIAYQKAVVVKYIENLIAWGDDLFRRDTIETITESTGLYILGRQLLGARPRKLDAPPPGVVTMAGQLGQSSAFRGALVETESLVPAPSDDACCGEPLPTFFTDYFCVPGNDKTTELWDTIADRLFKIRNSMNIEGVVRELALFEPPIDPALLVLAAATGVDLQSVLADASAGTLPYRFQVVHSRAMELASGVSSLGQALLQALEKRDGEALARMRQTQEIDLLRATRATKALEVKEAREAVAAAEAGQATIQRRLSHYEALLEAGVSQAEQASVDHTFNAAVSSTIAGSITSLAATLAPIPNIKTGVAGLGPLASVSMPGGESLSAIMNFGAGVANLGGTVERARAEAAATSASHQRRSEDWTFQVQVAKAELKQAAKQVASAKIRQAIATAALETHDLQTENARAVDDFMRDKLTNEDLYDWMSDKITDLYYEAYKLAFDMAKRAEKAFQTELAIDGAPKYITFGYWDSAKRGLLSGEQLMHGLRVLEVAYHEQNKRELEITRHVSLATLFPVELLALRETGQCSVVVPESLFAYDFPSHYLRRLRHVSLSASGVAGPYASVNCTLRLTASAVRRKPKLIGVPLDPVAAQVQSIVTSSGQADGGMFETNLRDERYLPFEGAGAISTWSVSLPPKTNAFDLHTMSDVVLHLQYTARDGGVPFGNDVAAADDYKVRTNLRRLIDVRAELVEVWAGFTTLGTSDVPLRHSDFRYLAGEKEITVTEVAVYVRRAGMQDLRVTFLPVADGDPPPPPEIDATTPPWSIDNAGPGPTGLHLAKWTGSKTLVKSGVSEVEALRLSIATAADAASVQDIYLVITYTQAIE